MKNFWAHFHVFWVQKRSCLSLNSDAFWKFSDSKVCREGSGRMFTFYGSKDKAVCFDVHAHFGSSLPVRFTEKVMGACSRFVCHANKYCWLQHFVKKLWSHFTILHANKSLLCCSGTLLSSWLSHFMRTPCFESEHIWSMTAPTNCDVRVWLYAKQFQKSLGLAVRHLRHVLWYLNCERMNRFLEIWPKVTRVAKLS